MDTSSAIAELRRNAGTQFDPEIVRAFCVAHERKLDAVPVSLAAAGA